MWLLTSSPYAPAAADWSSESTLPTRILAQYATSNGKLSQSSAWLRRCKPGSWTQRLCGRMSPPSMASRGVESWISSLRATRANHSPASAQDMARTILDTYGPTSVALLKSLSPNSCSSKTWKITSDSDSTPSSPTYSAWASALQRDSTQRLSSARTTAADESSSSAWQTPTLRGGEARGPAWGRTPYLRGQVLQWPTPTATDHKGSASLGQRRGQLDEATEQRYSHPLPSAPTGQQPSPTTPRGRRRLNPRFVEWLMGWPLGWTAFACSETEWSLWCQAMRSSLCSRVSPTNP